MTTAAMLPRERVFAALNFQPPDILPLEYHASPSGSFEHGEQLHLLWERYPQDFGLTSAFAHAAPESRWVDAHGRYREVRRDEWGVVWEHLIFGAAGHPLARPLDDWANLDRYQPPPDPVTSGPQFECERARAQCHRQRYFHKSGWINLFEVMIAVRRFEDVLMDIASDTPEINRLADLITDFILSISLRYCLCSTCIARRTTFQPKPLPAWGRRCRSATVACLACVLSKIIWTGKGVGWVSKCV